MFKDDAKKPTLFQKEIPINVIDPLTISETLAQRGERYGDFADHARIADDILAIMQRGSTSWSNMQPFQRQALRVIADKIARILNGDPNYDDNWRDIAGYATLVLQRLPAPPTNG